MDSIAILLTEFILHHFPFSCRAPTARRGYLSLVAKLAMGSIDRLGASMLAKDRIGARIMELQREDASTIENQK